MAEQTPQIAYAAYVQATRDHMQEFAAWYKCGTDEFEMRRRRVTFCWLRMMNLYHEYEQALQSQSPANAKKSDSDAKGDQARQPLVSGARVS